MSSELAYEASDEASESELLERSLSVWKGWNSIEWEDFAPTPLDIHTACSIGHYEWVRSIILKGGDPGLDRRNRGGWTPLMYACYIGHDNIVNLLINAGCNMNMKNSRGHTPLMLAASCGNESVARTLVRKGADLELIDKTGWTALFHATYAGHQNFVAYLLEAGANKDAIEPSSGTTPFMEASAEGHEIIVQLLLQHGVNVNAKAHNGYMARSLALMNGHMKVVSLIDNNVLPNSCLRSETGLDIYCSSSNEAHLRRQHPSVHNKRLKSKGPSIRDGPEAIARMIDRTRHTEPLAYHNLLVPKGYVSFPVCGADKEETKMSYRDVTSPINPEDYKDSSGSRVMSDLDDINDDSNAFTKTGAITIKSSSSSSGGLVAALGLSRESSLDSDDSHSYDQTGISSDDILEDTKVKGEGNMINISGANDGLILPDQNLTAGLWSSQFPGKDNINIISSSIINHSSINIHQSSMQIPSSDNEKAEIVMKQDNGIVSPLRDYLPLDSSFPVGSAAPASSSQEANNGKPWLVQHQPHSSSTCEQVLPKDNMTQVEIVNRFLKNLTMNNPETSTGQNRWADEASNQSTSDVFSETSLHPHHFEGYGATTSVNKQNINSSSRLSLSKHVDCKNVEQPNNDNVLSQGTNPGRIGLCKKDVLEMPPQQQTEADGISPRVSSNSKSSKNVQAQPLQRSNYNHHQKGVHEHISNQPWPHRPQLNHHHPLHNRHDLHHNSLSHFPDTSLNNVRNTPLRSSSTSHTPVVSHAEISVPTMHNLPQDYFYSDIEAADHFHQHFFESESEVPIHIPATVISQVDINSKLESAPCPLSHVTNPLLCNPVHGLHSNIESLISENLSLASQVQSGKANKAANQNITIPHNVDQADLKSQQPPSSISSPRTATRKHQLPSQPQSVLPQSSVQATVIIPGHVTSQPVCSTIDWDLPGRPESLGPRDLTEMLSQLGLTKYLDKFVEQDVDLQVFLSMTDNDLKELGVKLFGPRKKMTNAIARWHSNAPIASNCLELAYADKLEAEMQEMAIQLNQACENEERLKAQVLQEQQLRSVTESCLMEERASWEQARQILLNTKAKMRTMGDLTSRLRLYHKELKKHLGDVSKQLSKDSLYEDVGQVSQTAALSLDRSSESCTVIEEAHVETSKRARNPGSHFSSTDSELFKKSEKYFKEMQQTLTSVVVGVEHLLKSTPNVSNIDKDRPQT